MNIQKYWNDTEDTTIKVLVCRENQTSRILYTLFDAKLVSKIHNVHMFSK